MRLLQNKLKQLENTICWVNEEEALFKFPQTAYADVGDINTIQSGEGKMKAEIEPYARLFTTVLKWQKAEKKWMDGAFLDLNSLQIKADIDEFSMEMVQLQKLFKSKFKQAALDGESKYSKMNLEDSDPNQLPPPLKICALTIAAINKFTENIRVISCLCNPGIRLRHWNQMSAIIGFDITPNSGSSLRKVLRLSLAAFMDKLEEVSVSATKEHALEISLHEMIRQWSDIAFTTNTYRDSTIRILGSVESIEASLDDHLVKTQTMRGSPYFKPFEKEVLGWEAQLTRIQDTITAWLSVQEKWLYLEPILTVEEIVRHLPSESLLFREVDGHWKTVMENVSADPRVLHTAGVEGMLEMLQRSLDLLKDISVGLSRYLEHRKLVFPRFFFLSNKEILQIVSETRDPTKVQPFLRNIFEGVQSLEFTDLQAIQGVVSTEGERIPLSFPIQPREAKGCVDKWLSELSQQMVATMEDLLANSRESYTSFKRAEWLLEWPGQVALTVCLLVWTAEIQEAIKGGEQALVEQCNRQAGNIQELSALLQEEKSHLAQAAIRSVIVQDLHLLDVTKQVHRRKIASENDFYWARQLKMTGSGEEQVCLNMLDVSSPYRHEYLGHVSRLVTTDVTEQGFLTLLTAFKLGYSGLLSGPTATGKSSLPRELAAYLGAMYRVKNGSPDVTINSLTGFLKGVASSGCWAVIEDLDRAGPEVLSLASVLLETLRSCTKARVDSVRFPGEEKFSIENGFFVTITQNSSYIGRTQIPDSLRVLFRPVSLVSPDWMTIAEVRLASYGFKSKELAVPLVSVLKTATTQLPGERHYSFGLRSLVAVLDLAQEKLTEEGRDEKIVLVEAIRAILTPRLCLPDVQRLDRVIDTHFPGTFAVPEVEDQVKETEVDGLILNQLMREKVTAVRSSLDQQTGLILIGPTCSGKSTILKQAAALRPETTIRVINPKALEGRQLFGQPESSDTGWKDGLVSRCFQEFSSCPSDGQRLLVFDGPLDTDWVENFNTLLDRNQVLCFESGECQALSNGVRVVFEATSLANISPATVSRCAVVYVDAACLTWTQLFTSWFNSIKTEPWLENHDVILQQLFQWLLPPLLSCVSTCRCSSIFLPPETSPVKKELSPQTSRPCVLFELGAW